jgi:hypothetical protein
MLPRRSLLNKLQEGEGLSKHTLAVPELLIADRAASSEGGFACCA